jgi:putative ABC transport system permease protein
MIVEFWTWLRYTLLRKSRKEFDDEVKFHLEQSIAGKMNAGIAEPEARRQALLEFGSVDATREGCEQQRPGWWTGILAHDFRYALRGVMRNPAFSIAVVLTLMLGIGSSSAVFTVIDKILFRPLPYHDGGKLVSVGLVAPIEPQEFMLGGSYYEWQDSQKPFVAMTSETGVESCDLNEVNPARLDCAGVEQNFLPTLGITPVVGRNFLPGEDRPNAPQAALISYALWRNRFHQDPSIAGRFIRINGKPTEIVGVLPQNFEMPRLQAADVLLPEALDVAAQRRADPGRPMWAFARLKTGINAQQAQAQLEPLFDYSLRLAPAPFRKEVHYTVRPLRDRQFHDVHRAAWILLGLVMMVLLIASANVASLLAARRTSRQHEIAVRIALGASSLRLLQEAILESLILSMAGVLAGVSLASLLLHIFITIAPYGMPFLNAAKIDTRVLIFSMSIGLLSTLGFGLIGGLSRAQMKALASRSALGLRHARFRQILVTTQIAAGLVLLSGGALLARSFWNLQHQNLGINEENVLTATISLGQTAYPTAERQMAFFERLQRTLRWAPGVIAVAMSDSLPPGGNHHDQIYASLHVEGQPRYTSGTGGNVAWRWITPDYFRALDIPLLAGSGFSDDEISSPNRFVVLSHALAERMFQGESPLGRQVHVANGAPADQDPPYTVVGVAANVKNGGLAAGEEPEYYRLRRDQAQDWDRGAVVLVKSNLPATTMAHWMREQISSLDPTLPIEVGTLHERVGKLAEQPRFEMLLVSYFAGVGLILAMVGLYGVTSFLMVQRRPEVGIRLALGAGKRDIILLVLASTMRMVVPGTIAGVALALLLSQFLSSLLFKVDPHDTATFFGATILLIALTVFASLFPAVAATRVDPMTTLRVD